MSPTILILSALLPSLISGSTEGGQKMDSIALLQQTLQYWWKIYKSYDEEVTLGYCWADYLLGSPTDPSETSPATQNCSSTIVEARTTQQNLFPWYVTADTVTPFGETQEGKHPREKRSESTISKFINDSDEHRVASRSKVIRRRKGWAMNKIERAVSNNYTKRNNENERLASTIDHYTRRRRRTVSIVAELLREAARDGHEFSSRGTNSHAVNPTPNPRNDDKVDLGSMELGAEDPRRKVLRSLTSHHHDSFVGDASRSFSLKVTHGGSLDNQRFPFRYSSSQKGNSRVDEMLPDPWMIPQKDHGIEDDPAKRRASLNNDGSSPTPSRSQFRRINAKYPHMSVVKLMDAEGNSSCDPTINSKTCREPEELSGDSLLSSRGGSAERSFLESRGSGGGTVKRNAFSQFKTASGSDRKKRHSRESSRNGRDVSTATIHPFFLPELHQQIRHENQEFPLAQIPQKSRQDRDLIQTANSATLLSDVKRIIKDYPDSSSPLLQLAEHSKLTASQTSQLSLVQEPTSLQSIVASVFRTLETFVQKGWQVINVVQTNMAIICTKNYLWSKFHKWIRK